MKLKPPDARPMHALEDRETIRIPPSFAAKIVLRVLHV